MSDSKAIQRKNINARINDGYSRLYTKKKFTRLYRSYARILYSCFVFFLFVSRSIHSLLFTIVGNLKFSGLVSCCCCCCYYNGCCLSLFFFSSRAKSRENERQKEWDFILDVWLNDWFSEWVSVSCIFLSISFFFHLHVCDCLHRTSVFNSSTFGTWTFSVPRCCVCVALYPWFLLLSTM